MFVCIGFFFFVDKCHCEVIIVFQRVQQTHCLGKMADSIVVLCVVGVICIVGDKAIVGACLARTIVVWKHAVELVVCSALSLAEHNV